MEITKKKRAYLSYHGKLVILKHVKDIKSITKTLSEFNIPKSTYYKWKKAFDKDGEQGLLRKHPVAYNHPNKIKEEIIEKILSLKKRIYWVPGRLSGTWNVITISTFLSPAFLEY